MHISTRCDLQEQCSALFCARMAINLVSELQSASFLKQRMFRASYEAQISVPADRYECCVTDAQRKKTQP